jgi:tetratricopeptide (TPR) repeat protein
MLDPYNPRSIIGLAVTLMEGNKLAEAETVLRNGIRFLDKAKRWELHLTLCRLLTHIGDDTGDHQYYSEALEEVSTAIRLKPEHSAPYFHGGIVLFKLEDYRGALRHFRRCKPEDEYCREAKLNEKRVRIHLHREGSRVSRVASLSLAVICLLQLAGLWIALLRTPSKVSTTMLTVLIPILLALIVVSVLLPWLSRLKVTGLEAELNAPGPKESLTSGPRGEIGFGSALPKSF